MSIVTPKESTLSLPSYMGFSGIIYFSFLKGVIVQFKSSHQLTLMSHLRRAFTDFGKGFEVIDATGEEPVTGMIAAISSEEEAVVTCLDETRHNLEDGDYVQFSEVKGMDSLNGAPPRKIKVLGPYTFSIGDTSDLGEYVSGGIFTQVKMPKPLDFKTFRESLSDPEILISDFSKFERGPIIHVGFQALYAFSEKHNGTLPRPRNEVFLSLVDDEASISKYFELIFFLRRVMPPKSLNYPSRSMRL